MKKALLALASVALASSAFAQGTIKLENNNTIKTDGSGTYKIPIWVDLNQNGIQDAGEGIGTYANTLGTTATLGLFIPGQATPFATALFRTDANGAFLGTPSTQTVNVPGAAPGTFPTLEVKAWTGTGGFSASSVQGDWTFTVTRPLGGDPGGGATPILPSGLAGFGNETSNTGFGITVPEPSTIALGVLGVGALFLRRRK